MHPQYVVCLGGVIGHGDEALHPRTIVPEGRLSPAQIQAFLKDGRIAEVHKSATEGNVIGDPAVPPPIEQKGTVWTFPPEQCEGKSFDELCKMVHERSGGTVAPPRNKAEAKKLLTSQYSEEREQAKATEETMDLLAKLSAAKANQG